VHTLFISDLHLCPTRPAINDIFFRFLAHEARQAEALYILGDLFEYWAGDDDLADPFNASVCVALKNLAASGVKIFFMAGNRDFLIGADFARAAGLTLLDEPLLLELYGQPTLVMHGDTLCTDDHAYMKFRTEARTPQWKANMLALPLAARKTKIEEMRRQSEVAKSGKSAEIMDAHPGAIAESLRNHGYPRLIHGHTHRPKLHLHKVDGYHCERWVLTDWYAHGGYLSCDETGCYAHTLA